MKKFKYVFLIISILFVINVKAANSLDLVCNTPKMFKDGYTNCDIMLNYNTAVSFVEFNYESDMKISFTIGKDADLSVNNNKVTLNYQTPINPNNTKILNVKIANNDDKLGEKKLLLNNIRVTSDGTSYSLDNQEKIINVITEADLSSNCNLDSITIDGESVPGFSPTKYKYTGLKANKRIIFLDAKRSDETSSATGLGNAMLTENTEKNVDLTVISENGTKCVYTLGITYVKENAVTEIKKSDNNLLDNIEIFNKDEKINFNFDKKKNNFDVTVENSVVDLTIKAILQDEKATFVSNYGPREVKLDEGKNTYQIKVQAENESIKIYTLNITRDKQKSGDTTLKSLIINGVEVLLKVGEFNYDVTLPNIYHKTDVKAIPNDEKAKVEFENIDIKEDANNILTIKVTAPNGDVSEYIVTIDQDIYKPDVVSKPSFERIIITGYNINFDINKREYTLKVSSDVEKLDIRTVPNNIDITILNNDKLKDGSVVTVKVIDGEIERVYEIKIEKQASMNTNIICYLFFIAAIIVLLVSIRFWVKNKK